MNNAYVLTLTDPTYLTRHVVGVFAAAGLAEMAQKEATANLTDEEYGRGVYFLINTFEIGKLYRYNDTI